MAVNETGVPPANKRSMVSENLDIKQVADKARKEMEKPDFMPSNDLLMLFAVEKLHDIAVSLGDIADAFKKASGSVGIQTVAPKPVAQPTPQPTPQPVQAPQPTQPTQPVAQPTGDASARMAEVKKELAEFLSGEKPLLLFDESTSAQFIIIKPNGFLGGNNFPKIAGVVKNKLGGEYISKGKDSHFRVPKIKQ